MSSPDDGPITFRPTGELGEEITSRLQPGGSRHIVAKRDLRRYYWVLRETCPTLPGPQAMALACVFNNIEIRDFILMARSMPALLEEAPDICFEPIDKTALADTIREWSLFERLAALDALERYWHCDQDLEEVGLAESELTVD